MNITLTAREIADLAGFAGLNVTQPPEEDADALFTVSECPAEGVKNYGEPSDPPTVSHYQFIAWCTDYPEEGCMGLGPEIDPPDATGLAAGFSHLRETTATIEPFPKPTGASE